jgi:hypothetical protein
MELGMGIEPSPEAMFKPSSCGDISLSVRFFAASSLFFLFRFSPVKLLKSLVREALP